MAIATGIRYISSADTCQPTVIVGCPVDKGKVFGIGYPKTATSSLSKALAILNYRSVHDPYGILPRFFPEELKNYRYDPAILDDHDAFAGIVCLVYRELDRAYPGSKFILTVRDEKKWLKSLRGHLANKANTTRMDAEIPLRPFVRSQYFNGKDWFIEEYAKNYLETFQQYNREVMEYFKGRDNLLVIDVEQGGGWDKLCEFLGRDIPAQPFPWKNRRSLQRSLRRSLKHWKRKLGISRKS